MSYKNSERRKYPRANIGFVVGYQPQEKEHPRGLSQTRNASLGGILINTNCYFAKGSQLLITIGMPVLENRVKLKGEVVDCQEIVKNVVYETRIKFFQLEQAVTENLSELIKEHI